MGLSTRPPSPLRAVPHPASQRHHAGACQTRPRHRWRQARSSSQTLPRRTWISSSTRLTRPWQLCAKKRKPWKCQNTTTHPAAPPAPVEGGNPTEEEDPAQSLINDLLDASPETLQTLHVLFDVALAVRASVPALPVLPSPAPNVLLSLSSPQWG